MIIKKVLIGILAVLIGMLLFNCTGSSDSNGGGGVQIPKAPTNLVATATSESSINLNWEDNSSNETNFVIQRSIESGKSFITIVTLDSEVTSYDDRKDLVASTMYYYRVYAFNSAGNSENSSEASTVTFPEPSSVPAAPSGLLATATSSNSITLIWTDNSSDETDFVVERSTVSGTSYKTIVTVGAGVTSYVDATGLTPSTTYYYRVYALNSVGNSSFTNEKEVMTSSVPVTAPNAPSNLVASSISSTDISLSWTDNSDNETSFTLQRSLSSGSGFVNVANFLTNRTHYDDIGLSASTQYFYRIYAENSVGKSANSNVTSATTSNTAATIPSAPSGLNASGVYINSVSLSWTDNSFNEAGFKIYKSTSSTGTYSYFATVGANTTSYSTGNTLSSSTDYYFKVLSYNSAGNSSLSPYKRIKTADASPSLSLPSTVEVNTNFTVSWTYGWGVGTLFASSADGFELQRSTSPTSNFVTVYSTTNDRASNKALTQNLSIGTYYYRVRAKLNTVLSNWSTVRSITVATAAKKIRIINDLYDTTSGSNDWGKMNQIIRVRVGTQANVTSNSNTYEKLTPYESLSEANYLSQSKIILPDHSLPQSSTSVWEIDASSFGSDYYVYIQNGWWEHGNNSWSKHYTRVLACDNSTVVKTAVLHTVGHTSGVSELKMSDFLPQGSYLGSRFCP